MDGVDVGMEQFKVLDVGPDVSPLFRMPYVQASPSHSLFIHSFIRSFMYLFLFETGSYPVV